MMNYKLPKLYDANNDLSKRWYVFYFYKNPDSGTWDRFRIFVSSKFHTKTGRRDEAHRIIKEMNQKLQGGWNPYQHSEKRFTSLRSALEVLIEFKLAGTRKRTGYTYRHMINAFLRYCVQNKVDNAPVSGFNSFYARDYCDYLKVSKKYNNRTFNNHLTCMKTIFNELVTREYITVNPFKVIKPLETEEPDLNFFTDEELETISDLLPIFNPRLWIIAQLIYYCFIRPQEIVRLKVSDFDLKRQQIIIRGGVGKNKRNQVIDIPNEFLPSLLTLNWNYPPDWHFFSVKLAPGPREIAQTRIDGFWDAFRQAVGFPESKKIYSLKHTGVGKLVDSGVDVRSIQLQIRHHSLEQTQQYLDKFRRRPNEALKKRFPKLGRS